MLLTLATACTAAFSALCAATVAAFLVLVMIPRLHSPVRAWLRPRAVERVESGLVLVAAAQRRQHPWLTWLFVHSSHSVSVTFYASFLPILFWLGFPELGRNLVFLMTLALYVGNAIKDLVCSPRPLGVPYGKQRLRLLGAQGEEAELNAKEYGLPSSHTLNSLCLNYFAVWYLYDRQLITAGTTLLLYGVVALWVVWIAASRLYLGLHTPVDILAGAVAGLAVLVCFIAVEGLLPRWLFSGPRAVLHAALASLLLLRLHPRPLEHTPSFQFSTSFMGAMFGLVVGIAWMSPYAHQPGVQLAQLWSGDRRLLGSRLLWAARRLALGFAVVGTLKEGSRAAFKAGLPFVYRFFPLAIRRLWQPPVHNLWRPAKAAAAAAAAAAETAKAAQQGSNGRHHGAPPPAGGSAQEEQRQGGEQAALRRRGAQPAGSAAAAGNSRRSGGSRGQPPSGDARLLAALPHNEHGMPWDVDVTSRFFAYAGIGLAVGGVSPRILDALGW
ncbi:hypothetical protein ABPG75_003218 [Micractinium tetrahymenae]